MGGALIPVVDHEKSWTERGNEQDAASKAHRAFQDPHSLHRGSAPENDVARDTGVGVVRKGTSKLVKNEKGQWVKPRHDRPIVVGDAAAPSAETAGKRDRDRPERFIPAKAWVGERSGYYFARGREGVGYYADDAQGDERWRETWRRLKEKEAEAREARREETRRGGEERRREDARDPDDYRGGKRYGGDRGDDYRGEKRPRGRDDRRDVRCRRSTDQRRQLTDHLQRSSKRGHVADEEFDPSFLQGRSILLTILLAIKDDDVGRQRDDRIDVRILGPADVADARLFAESRARNDVGSEVKQRLGTRWNEADNAHQRPSNLSFCPWNSSAVSVPRSNMPSSFSSWLATSPPPTSTPLTAKRRLSCASF